MTKKKTMRYCGKFGHKSADCFSKGKSEKSKKGQNGGVEQKAKFNGDCFKR